jgi:hypothetical protein
MGINLRTTRDGAEADVKTATGQFRCDGIKEIQVDDKTWERMQKHGSYHVDERWRPGLVPVYTVEGDPKE